MKRILFTSLFVLLISTIASSNEAKDIWFSDIDNRNVISRNSINSAVKYLTKVIFNTNDIQVSLPDILKSDTSPRILFLSVSNGSPPPYIIQGRGKGMETAISRTIDQLQKNLPEGYKPKWLKIDFVTSVQKPILTDFYMPKDFDRSLSGIAFEKKSKLAFLPELLLSKSLISNRNRIEKDALVRFLENTNASGTSISYIQNNSPYTIMTFSVASYFITHEGISPLYRGHQLYPQLSIQMLRNHAIKAGEYLIRAVQKDGKFVYSYNPLTNTSTDSYNILRHAGTIYSMMELYEYTRNKKLLAKTKLAIDYLLKHAKPVKAGNEELLCIVRNNFAKLGGNALACIALAKYTEVTEDPTYVPILKKLGKWLLISQKENGEFPVHKQTFPDGKRISFVSQYYPGETILALLRINQIIPSESWVTAAEKAALFLIKVRDKDVPDSGLNHDHWFLYGLNELYRLRPDPLFLTHARRISRVMMNAQNTKPTYPDWYGSYYKPPRSTPTATRSEGLCAAFDLIRDFGTHDEAVKIFNAIKNGISFQLQTQFSGASALYLKNPFFCLGGFHESLTDFDIRIDYVQHNISSILYFSRILQQEISKNNDTK